MKIYTKTGDKGTTSLVGGTRVSKAELRIEAYGTLDELTAHLGYLASDSFEFNSLYKEQLSHIVSRVMDCGAIVASEDSMLEKLPKVSEIEIKELERWCDELLDGLPQLRFFTLPIGAASMSYCHVCRTVARRAERAMVRAVESGSEIGDDVMRYINRLSDYLYALCRRLSAESGVEEQLWMPSKK